MRLSKSLKAAAFVASLALLPATTSAFAASPPKAATAGRIAFTVPGLLAVPQGAPIPYENGFMLVPENRNVAGSRLIAVRYLRFPAQAGAAAKQTPVFMLPGGPGTLIDEKFLYARPSYVEGIRRITRTRDYVVIQQRGIEDGAYAASPTYDIAALDPARPKSPAAERERLRNGVEAGIKTWSALGVDLRGYSVPELVADVDDLRQALGHPKLILYAGSFGSQWSLAYIRTHPDKVARAVLTGLEPLDYGWDDPASLWAAMGRIGGYAAADPAMAAGLPNGSLTTAYEQAIRKLEQSPQTVTVRDPRTGQPAQVAVTADDLRGVRYPVSGSRRASVEAWPRFVMDIANGDYRYLATLVLRNRRGQTDSLSGETIDGSLAITKAREQALASHTEARQWLGDPNIDYSTIRDLLPVKPVGEDFLRNFRIDFPIVILQGDVDLSTPLENALDQAPLLTRGKLVVVRRGTHDVKEEIWSDDIIRDNGAFFTQVMTFLSEDTAAASIDAFPAKLDLAPFNFVPLTGPSLYERSLPKQASATP